MTNKIITILLISASLAFGATAYANIQGQKNESCKCSMMEHKSCACKKKSQMLSSLNLTPGQESQIKAIRDKLKENMMSNHEKMKSIKEQIKSLIKSEKIDEAKLEQLIEQKKSIVGDTMKNRVMSKNKIYNLLTPEQKSQYSSMMDNWEKSRKEKMHKMMHDSLQPAQN